MDCGCGIIHATDLLLPQTIYVLFLGVEPKMRGERFFGEK
jgi:hypothetical protein